MKSKHIITNKFDTKLRDDSKSCMIFNLMDLKYFENERIVSYYAIGGRLLNVQVIIIAPSLDELKSCVCEDVYIKLVSNCTIIFS